MANDMEAGKPTGSASTEPPKTKMHSIASNEPKPADGRSQGRPGFAQADSRRGMEPARSHNFFHAN
jgi:hypothetical protein